MYAKKNSGKKLVVLLLVVVLLIGCTIGGTIAYLIAEHKTVTNTFVAGAIGTLELAETDKASQNAEGQYIIVPGKTITKDPKVTYTPAEANDVGEVYVFVQVSGGNWTYTATNRTFTADSLNWVLADNWIPLSNVDGNMVFYQKVSSLTGAAIIKDNTVAVGSDIVKGDDMTQAVNAASGLTFTAHAIQAEGFADDAEGTENGKTAAQKAWSVAQPANS